MNTATICFHRQTVYIQRGHEHTRRRNSSEGGVLSKRARVRRYYGPLCSTLVAAKSGSICITVVLVSVSGGVSR